MRWFSILAVTLLTMALSMAPASAGPTPSLASAPTGFTCSLVADTVECSWDALAGATKYSVDVVANYVLADASTSSADFDFGTALTTLSIPLSSFPTDVNGDLAADTLSSLVLRVKGLNPPGKSQYNQHTPFSSTILCTVGGSCAPAI
jgi:hypothetical protein